MCIYMYINTHIWVYMYTYLFIYIHIYPQTEEIGLKKITMAKISNNFSYESPYISNTFSRESSTF